MAKITGIARWACVHRPGKFGDYSINVIVDKKEAAKLKELGLKVNKTEEGELVFKPKRCAINKKSGEKNAPPVVVDSKKNPLTADVGNGSEVNVVFKPFQYSNSFGKGHGADLMAIQVLKLVSFNSALDELDEEEGFIAEDKGDAIEELDDDSNSDDGDDNPEDY